MKTINLNALDKTTASVEWNGVAYPVKQVTARIANIIASAEEADGLAKMLLYYDAVALLIPTMPRGEVDNLTADHLAAIIAAAGSAVEVVNEAATDPNAPSPAPGPTSGELAAT